MEIYENLDLENIDGEIWKEIEGFDGDYQVSNLGRVKSFKKYHGTDVRILIQNEDGGGYLFVNLYKNKEKPKPKQIHTLMYEQYIEEIPKGCVIHHIDSTKNNFLENFEMMTQGEHAKIHHEGMKRSEESKKLMSENHVGMLGLNHSEKTKELMKENNKGKNNPNYGKDFSGENNPHSTLKNQDVIQIRKLCDEGNLTQKEIGEKFGVSRMTISRIKNRKSWTHIKSQSL